MRQAVLSYLICALCMTSVFTRSPSVAHASLTTQQREHFKSLVGQAVKAYKEDRFPEAIELFETALKLKSEYRLHWNLAVLYERTGRLEVALGHIDQFLKDPSLNVKNRDKAEARRRQIIDQIERERPTRLAVLPKSSPIKPSPKESDLRPVEAQIIEVEKVSTMPMVREEQGLPSWSYWAIASGVSGLTSLGFHLYANSIWDELPNVTSEALDAQSRAWTYSWVGDFFLVGSIASLSIAVWKWTDEPTSQASTALSPRSSVGQALRSSELTFIGQGFLWRGRF